MKKIRFILYCLMLGTILPAYAQNVATLKGRVHSWKNDGQLLIIGAKGQYDTVRVAQDGSFSHKFNTTEPVEKGLYLEYLGDDRTVINCYLVPGQTTELKVTGEKVEGRLRSVPEFSGVNRKECEYLHKTSGFWCNFSPVYTKQDGSVIRFCEYKEQLAAYQDTLREMLKTTRKEFRAPKLAVVDELPAQVLFSYAWGAQRNKINPAEDPGFMDYYNSIDLNKMENVKITEQWLRFYQRTHPAGSPENSTLRFLQLLREKISNPDVRNQLADEKMHIYFAVGGDEAMPEIFAEYKKTSTNPEALAKIQPVYDRLSRLIPGVEASDFEMQTVDGKSVHFRDIIGKGKVTYIDFWATWCGPCCGEIPFVEKLVEKYKGNPNIEFLSISLDNDLKKWHQKLEKDQPLWPQFVIPENFDSIFAKEYNITAIPRFMIFDKEGKIININAPRPSSDKIDTFLQKYIQ